MILDNSDWRKFGNSRSISLNQGIYNALSQYYPLLREQGKLSNGLFSNLQVLKLTDAELPLAHHVLGFPAVFATVPLRTFKLDIPLMGSVEPSVLSDLLLALKAGCPNLSDLVLELNRSQDVPETALNAISGIKSLRTLHLSGSIHMGNFENLSSFASLPQLQSLKVSHTDFAVYSSSSTDEFDPLLFLTLTSLSIAINVVSSAPQSYFRCLKLPKLKQLWIQITNPAWQQFHARIHKMVLPFEGSKTVETLILEGMEKAQIGGAVAVVDIPHLFSFTNLTHLEIDSLHFFISDENTMLQRIAEAWPRLRKLILNDISLHSAAPFPISALLHLSRDCLQLEELNLMIDARVPPPSPYPTTKEVKHNTCLRRLVLYRSPLSDPRPVADYLKYLFPALETVRHQSLWRSHISTEYNELWLRVNEHLTGG